jgi:N-acetylmuramoyl-L-alanine amidase
MKKILIILFAFLTVLSAQDLSGKKLYVNAGHGGHDSSDRPPVTPAGFWESEGNLTRALVMETILKRWGATVVMSRRHNRHSDGIALSSLGTDASNQNCDWFHSTHTNASGGNSTLMLYPGFTGDPRINNGYTSSPSPTKFPGMITMSDYMGNNIVAACQTTSYRHAGDYTFYGSGDNYLGVFRYLNIPGTLSESSFHDYWPNTWRLQNLDYRINDAWALSLAFLQYYGQPLPAMRNLAGIVRTTEELTDYEYIAGTNDQYKPVDSIVVTIYPVGHPDSRRVYYGNRTMYVYEYTRQWSQITSGSPISSNWATVDNSSDYDYYMNGYNNNHGYNTNNGFYLFDSLAYGSYEMVFEAPGFWPDTVQVTIDNSKFFWTRNFFMTSSLPPYVKSFTPQNNETEHPAWEPIVLQFSHAMDTSAVRSGLTLVPATDLTYTWSDNLKQLTLRAVGDSLDVETAYTLTLEADSITGNRDQNLDGNGDGVAGDDFVINFTTSPRDIFAPSINVWFPAKYARHADLQPIISYIYDEIIDTTDLDIADIYRFYRTTGDDIEIPTESQVYVVNGKTIVSFFPTEELERGNSYMRVVNKGVSDLFGNTTTANQTGGLLINSTIPYYADTVVIDDFSASSITSNWRNWDFSGSNRNLIAGERVANTKIVNHCNGSESSMKLYYKFDPEAQDGLYRQWLSGTSAPAGKKFDDGDVLQAWVFGDGSNNKFRFAVDDPTDGGISEVSPWYDLDFIGWRLLKWDLRTGETGDWPSISDGTLNGDLTFDSFQIEYIDSLGTNEGTIYIEDLMVMTPGGVAIADTDIPADFNLAQNYPNPFNPSTAISYQLPVHSHVKLSVYNVNGREVANLIDQAQGAGHYTVNFNAGPLPSGVYIARLKTDLGILNTKMLLVK